MGLKERLESRTTKTTGVMIDGKAEKVRCSGGPPSRLSAIGGDPFLAAAQLLWKGAADPRVAQKLLADLDLIDMDDCYRKMIVGAPVEIYDEDLDEWFPVSELVVAGLSVEEVQDLSTLVANVHGFSGGVGADAQRFREGATEGGPAPRPE